MTENGLLAVVALLIYMVAVLLFGFLVQRRRARRGPGMQYTATIVNDPPALVVTQTYEAFPVFGWWYSPGFGFYRDPQALVREWREHAAFERMTRGSL